MFLFFYVYFLAFYIFQYFKFILTLYIKRTLPQHKKDDWFRCQRLADWPLTPLQHRLSHWLATALRLLFGHLSYPSQQHWSRALPLYSHMLTAYLTTGVFVRLTNRPPFPSLMSFEHFIAIWPAALEPQREWSMMETPYKKKINQTHFNSNVVRERGQRRGWEMQRITRLTLRGGGERALWVSMVEKILTISFFTLCDNKAVNSSPLCLVILSISSSAVCLLFTLCVVCSVSCSEASC